MRALVHRITRALVVVLMIVLVSAPTADAGSAFSGPSVTVDRATVSPGDHVILTMEGFTALSVTISICGNEARRGSADCNMAESDGVRLDTDGTSTKARMPIAEPPADCPCVIRVSTANNDEVAVTPITIIGHKVGPLVDGVSLKDPLTVTINARPAARSAFERLRPSLGGPSKYEVTVTVKNTSTVTLHHVKVFGSAARASDDNLATLQLDDPGEIKAGQTWKQTVSAVVPAPSFGAIEWHVDVSGAGPTVSATDTTRQRPVLLLMVAMLIVVNIGFLLIRSRVRRRAAAELATAAAAATEAEVGTTAETVGV